MVIILIEAIYRVQSNKLPTRILIWSFVRLGRYDYDFYEFNITNVNNTILLRKVKSENPFCNPLNGTAMVASNCNFDTASSAYLN